MMEAPDRPPIADGAVEMTGMIGAKTGAKRPPASERPKTVQQDDDVGEQGWERRLGMPPRCLVEAPVVW